MFRSLTERWTARRRDSELARRLYDRIVVAARQPALYLRAGVPDNAEGRFDMVALHAFVLFNRMAGEDDWQGPGSGLADVMVADLEASLREMGAGDMKIGKKVKRLAQGLYGRFDAYWGALQADGAAEDDSGPALTAALARNVYAGMEAGPQLAADFMRPYLLRQIAAFAAADAAQLRRGELCFVDPEDCFAGEAPS